MTEATSPAPEVVVVGSANLDLVVDVVTIPVAGETVLGGDLRRIPGGKGANQAVAASRLGRRVAMVGRVGDDDAGSLLRSALDSAGVDTEALAVTSDTPSGTALITVGSDGDNAIVVSPGANGHLSVADIEAAADVIAASKVLLLQLEIPLEPVTAAARYAHGTVVLNPAPAPEIELPPELLRHVDVLVPNQTEFAPLASYHGNHINSIKATNINANNIQNANHIHSNNSIDANNIHNADGIHNAHDINDIHSEANLRNWVSAARCLAVPAVVVTLGAGGAMVITDGHPTHVPAPTVTPVDTTAAGDAFCGALADALVDNADLVQATRWAVQVGAATTLRAGAQPSLPTPTEVRQLLKLSPDSALALPHD